MYQLQLRFRIRTLLLFVFLAAVLFASGIRDLRLYWIQADALEKLGAGLSIDFVEADEGQPRWLRYVLGAERLTQVRQIQLSGQLNQPDLLQLARLPWLQSLDFRQCQMVIGGAPVDFGCFTKTTSLRSISLDGCEIDDRHVKQLATVNTVEELNFFLTMVTDNGIAEVAKMPKIRKIVLSPENTDNAVMKLASNPAVREIDLEVSDVTAQGLGSISPAHDSDQADSRIVTIGAREAIRRSTPQQMTHLRPQAELDFSVLSLADDDLRPLTYQVQARTLSLRGPEITDAGLEYLSGMKQLYSLELSQTAVTAAGIAKQLGHLEQLEQIRVNGSPGVTMRGLVESGMTQISGFYGPVMPADLQVASKFPRLRYLALEGRYFDGKNLLPLANCSSLKILELKNTAVTDNVLAALSGLSELQILRIYNPYPTSSPNWLSRPLSVNGITNEGLQHIGQLRSLTNLTLSGEITDAGLRHLRGLERLIDIDLERTEVTQAGLAELEGLPLEFVRLPNR